MTIGTFFVNFRHLADAPNGVQKLRELILQLAVQGKLVPQNPSDESASVLLEKIKAEKTELNKKARGKRNGEIAPVDSIKVPFNIPEGWEWARFVHVASIASNLVKPDEFQDSIHVAPDNIEKGNGRLLPCRTVKEDKVRSSNHAFYSGQIIYSKIRPNLSKMTIVDFGGLCSADMYPINAHILPGFLLKYMLSETFLGMAVKKDTRVAMPKINQEELNKILVPVPPIAEQKRIVAKVDRLMALCDELEARQQKQQQGRVRLNNAALDALLTAREPDEFADHWQRISTNFDLLYDHPETIAKLRAAILQVAVQGKLVPQDPNDEPASVLPERIQADKERLVKEGALKKGKVLPKIDLSERPFVGSSSHIFVRLQDVCRVVTDGDHQPPPKTESGVPFLVIGNVRTGHIDFAGSRYVSSGYFEKLDPQRVPQIGDILYTVVGSYGIPVSVATDKSFCVQRHIAIIKPSSLIDADFLRFSLSSKSALEQATACATGIAQKTVPLSGLRKLILSLPPIEEQKRIVAKVDQLMVLCDELEAKLNQTQQHSEKLMEATVRQFLGSSTPQKPHVAKPVRKPPETKPVLQVSAKVTAKPEFALPLVAETPATYTGNVPQAILEHMQPGTEYSRADIRADLGLSTADWNWAIRQLKE